MATPIQKQVFDPSANVLLALLWMHNNAARLTCLMRGKQDWVNTNQRDFWDAWKRDVFDLRTANAFGLQVWGIILGVPVSISDGSSPVIRPAWGFEEFNENFNNGNFLPSMGTTDPLTIDEARFVLQLRYFSLICRPCTWQINEFLSRVFPTVSCRDTLNMSTIIYNFETPVSPALMGVLLTKNIFPRPATVGVAVNVMGRDVFGFGEYNENFNNGNFVSA